MLIREGRSQMPEPPETVAINMDGKALLVEKGLTILQVAQQNNVYIPNFMRPQRSLPVWRMPHVHRRDRGEERFCNSLYNSC